MIDYEINYKEDIFEVEEFHLPIINNFKFLVSRAISNFCRINTRIVITFDYYPREMKFNLVEVDKKSVMNLLERAFSYDKKNQNS